MKIKTIKTCTKLIAFIYVITILFYSFSLVFEFKLGKKNAAKELNSITRIIYLTLRECSPEDESFVQEIKRFENNFTNIQNLKLIYKDKIIYEYNSKYQNIFTNENSPLLYGKSTNLEYGQNQIIQVIANFYLIKPSSIHKKGLISSIIIFFTIIFNLIILYKSKNIEEDDEENFEVDEWNQIEDRYEEFENVSENLISAENLSEEEIKISSEENQVSDETFPNFEERSKDENKSETEEIISEEKNGFYCENTKFSNYQYLNQKLEDELLYSASNEIDLAILNFEIDKINWENEQGKKISTLILEKVRFNDMIFNYKNKGFIALFRDLNTDKAFEKAEEIYLKIKEELSENKIYCGISTRGQRLISNTRILKEAEEALNRAKNTNENNIIAFKIDPEKYMNYLKKEKEKLDNLINPEENN